MYGFISAYTNKIRRKNILNFHISTLNLNGNEKRKNSVVNMEMEWNIGFSSVLLVRHNSQLHSVLPSFVFWGVLVKWKCEWIPTDNVCQSIETIERKKETAQVMWEKHYNHRKCFMISKGFKIARSKWDDLLRSFASMQMLSRW